MTMSRKTESSRLRRSRIGALLALMSAAVVLACIGVARREVNVRSTPRPESESGGTLVGSIRAEPRTFNRYMARDLTSTVVASLTHASLVRVNRATDALEPDLAERWTLLPDGRTFRVSLRPGIRFSDGVPFTAADVTFSFAAIYDRRTESVLADTLRLHGRELEVTAENNTTVLVRFPFPFGPGLRLLDGVPVLPRHLLEQALLAGTFAGAWGVTTAASDLAGLGPFELKRYDVGERLVFDRNPNYWRDQEARQPRKLEHLVLEVVPDQDAEALRMLSGDIDFTQSEVRPIDIAPLRRAAEQGRIVLRDVGIALDGDLFWINLRPGRVAGSRAAWLQHSDFRRAISHAIDRRAFVDQVYFGAAVPGLGVISPGSREWLGEAAVPPYDLESAAGLLRSLQLVDRDHDGMLEDASGNPVRFTLLTQSGNTSLDRGAAFVRESLARVGVRVDVAKLEVGALVQAVTTGAYEAAYFRLLTTDSDPALNPDFWFSAGSAHVWNPGQLHPATDWEAAVDRLMSEVSTATEPARRHALFAEVQRIMSREVPFLCFGYPRLSVAMSSRVADARPAPYRPPLLWSPETLRPAE